MRAAIDIGSNSVRLAIAGGATVSEITKLADGLSATGALSEEGKARTLDVLLRYAAICRESGADKIIVFATEAVRNARDGEEFCALVKKKIGLTVTVLSPEKEAALALAGATKPAGAVTVCDLGGGSMEIISSADGKTPDYIKSLPLGVVNVKNRFPALSDAIKNMPALVKEYGTVPDRPVVFCGGSACAIAAGILDLKTYDKSKVSTRFTIGMLDDFMPILSSKSLAVMRPVLAKRADTAPFGAVVMLSTLNHIGRTDFFVSDASNLEAALGGFEV